MFIGDTLAAVHGLQAVTGRGVLMKKAFLILSLIFLLFGASIAFSGETEKNTLVFKIMEQSGANEQIRQIPLLVSSALSDNHDLRNLAPESYAVVEKEAAKLFNAERMIQDVAGHLERKLDAKTMEEVLVWLDSDAGRKITAMEKSASTPAGVKAAAEFARRPENATVPQNRLDLVERFVQATKISEAQADVIITMGGAVAAGLNAALPPEKRVTQGDMKREMEAMRPRLEMEIRKACAVSALFIYKDLEDEELQRYVQFAESPGGRRYHVAVFGAIKESMRKSGLEIGKTLPALYIKMALKDGRSISGRFAVKLKNGRTLQWKNYAEKENRYCTASGGGELCLNKSDVASIEAE